MKRFLFIQDKAPGNVISNVLASNGWEFEVLPKSSEPMSFIKTYSPDVLILDLAFNHNKGIELLYLTKEDTLLRSILTIGIGSSMEQFRLFMDMGGDDFFVEPINSVNFIEVLKRRIKIQESRLNLPIDFSQNEVANLNELKDKAVEEIILDEGEYLFRTGKSARYLYYLREGSVKTILLDENGNELITSILLKNDFVGFKPLIEERNYYKDGVALERSVLLKIPRSEVFKSLSGNTELSKTILLSLSQQYTSKEEDLLYLAYSSVKERLSIKLIDLFQELNKKSLNINREDLANLIGSTPETVVRALSDLKSEGHIITKGSLITCLNLKNYSRAYKP